jgi:RNA polymerase sigma-70 factor (ECF subfamily)
MVRRLYGTATLIVRDSEAANDAVQETLIEVWRNLPGLRDRQAFDGWVRKILVRRCYRQIKERQRRRMEVEVGEIDMPTASHDARVADVDRIERAFRKLSPEHRAVLVLHHREGLPLDETADALGIPLGTAKSRLNRAAGALRAAIDAEDRVVAPAGGVA